MRIFCFPCCGCIITVGPHPTKGFLNQRVLLNFFKLFGWRKFELAQVELQNIYARLFVQFWWFSARELWEKDIIFVTLNVDEWSAIYLFIEFVRFELHLFRVNVHCQGVYRFVFDFPDLLRSWRPVHRGSRRRHRPRQFRQCWVLNHSRRGPNGWKLIHQSSTIHSYKLRQHIFAQGLQICNDEFCDHRRWQTGEVKISKERARALSCTMLQLGPLFHRCGG